MNIILSLTEEQAEKLSETLHNTNDCGPVDEGWQSDELEKLCDLIDQAINKGHKKRT
jgi:hypothetical protein